MIHVSPISYYTGLVICNQYLKSSTVHPSPDQHVTRGIHTWTRLAVYIYLLWRPGLNYVRQGLSSCGCAVKLRDSFESERMRLLIRKSG